VAQLHGYPPVRKLKTTLLLIYAPEVDETTLGEENDVPARGHCVTVNLRLNVDRLLGVCLQPGHIDLNIEVANTARWMLTSV
jgi:hypothetical protein